MPVKVTKKGSLQSVAKAPTPSANKGEKIKVEIKNLCYPSITDMDKYKGAMVFNPACDWLEFGSPVDQADIAELQPGWNATLHGDEIIKVLGPMEKKKDRKAKGYKFAGYWMGTKDPDGHVLIKYAPANNQSRYFVLCMNPSRMTAKEMEDFWSYWGMLCINHPKLKRDALLSKSDTILRVDIAVDLLNVVAGSVVANKKAGKSAKKKVQIAYQTVSGRLETKYLPHVKGAGATEYYYDKRKERIERGAEYKYGENPMTRFEFRVETERPVNELAKLSKHFDRFMLSMFDRKALKGKSSTLKLFAEQALTSNLEKALALLSSDQERKECKAFFTDNLVNIWEPKLLTKGWLRELKRVDFMPKKKVV